jgi:PTH1 family peptidyl-tRNA hydrolase
MTFSAILLIVGLGNPGEQYVNTRHNVGFMAVDAVAHFYDFPPFKLKNNALISEHTIGEQKVILVKPQTYMNLSGQTVGELARFYKIAPDQIYAIHDDLDLCPGKIKIKQGGGHGGHNGLRSMDAHLGKNYWRVRLGIGHPGNRDLVTPYVLGKISATEAKIFEEQLYNIARNFKTLVSGNRELFLTKMSEID